MRRMSSCWTGLETLGAAGAGSPACLSAAFAEVWEVAVAGSAFGAADGAALTGRAKRHRPAAASRTRIRSISGSSSVREGGHARDAVADASPAAVRGET